MALEGPVNEAVERRDPDTGYHDSDTWLIPKPTSQLLCSEPQHTKGSNARGCRMCSKPVCEGCIIKASFGKQENTFQSRRRRFCGPCWLSGNRHAGARMDDPCAKRMPYTAFVQAGNFCCCTADDGWLCMRCKTAQNADQALRFNKCCGQGCENSLEDDEPNRRICLWCDSPLEERLAKNEARRVHDSRHLYAKSNSCVEKRAFITGWGNYGPLWSDYVEFLFEQNSQPLPLLRSRVLDPGSQEYLRHLGKVNYDALCITPPDTKHILQSCRGFFRYDINFLLQFRRRCAKALPPDWDLQPVRTMTDLSLRPENWTSQSHSMHAEPAIQPDPPVLSLDTDTKERDEEDGAAAGASMETRPKVSSPTRIGKHLFLRLKLRRKRTSDSTQVPEMAMRDSEASQLLDMSANRTSMGSCASVASFSTFASKDLYHGTNMLAVGRSII